MSDFELADSYGNPLRYVGKIKSPRAEELSLQHDNIRHKISRLKTKREKTLDQEEIQTIEKEIERLTLLKQSSLADLTNSMFHHKIKAIHFLWAKCVEELCGFEQLQECIEWLEIHTQEAKNV